MGIRVQDVERLHLGLLAAAVCVALAIGGWLSAASVLLGGAVMAANVWLLRQLTGRLLVPPAPGQERRPAIVVALLLAKFTIFMGLLGLLFWRVPLDAPAFAVGASLLLVASVVAALRAPRPVAA